MLGLDLGSIRSAGAEIAIESFAAWPIDLVEGRNFALDTALDSAAGD